MSRHVDKILEKILDSNSFVLEKMAIVGTPTTHFRPKKSWKSLKPQPTSYVKNEIYIKFTSVVERRQEELALEDLLGKPVRSSPRLSRYGYFRFLYEYFHLEEQLMEDTFVYLRPY